MSHVFSAPSFEGLATPHSGYLREVTGYSMIMALIVAVSAFITKDLEFYRILSVFGLGVMAVCVYSAGDFEDGESLTTLLSAAMSAFLVGFLAAQAAAGIDSALLSMTLWAAGLTFLIALVGTLLPGAIEKPWGLVVLFGLPLFLAICLEPVAFLHLLYWRGGEVAPYQMTWWAWIAVLVYLWLTALCWYHGAGDAPTHDNAIQTAGGPLLNIPDLAGALGQMLDRLDQSPWSDGSGQDEEA